MAIGRRVSFADVMEGRGAFELLAEADEEAPGAERVARVDSFGSAAIRASLLSARSAKRAEEADTAGAKLLSALAYAEKVKRATPD